MADLLKPAPATCPEQALDLVRAALSAGDLDGALAHYSDAAVLVTWDRVARGRAIRPVLASLAAVHTPLRGNAVVASTNGRLAVVEGEWALAGAVGDGTWLQLQAHVSAVVRLGADGAWRVELEVWSSDPLHPPHFPQRRAAGS